MNTIQVDDNLPLLFGEIESCQNVWLTLTNLCNMHCKYCFNYVSRCHEHMSPELAIGIMTAHLSRLDTSINNPIRIHYFGGEPTLNYATLIKAIDSVSYTHLTLPTNREV